MAEILSSEVSVPKRFVKDIERAVNILKEEGCQEIYLFGSLATGQSSDSSDIDLGIKSYPKNQFFKIYGRLMMDLNHKFNLVDFELNHSMFEVLNHVGEVRRIA